MHKLLGKINKSFIYKLPIIVFPYVVIVENRTEIMDPLIACIAACLAAGVPSRQYHLPVRGGFCAKVLNSLTVLLIRDGSSV